MSLIITGNPGVGKHTIADGIMKSENYDLIDINKIAIKSNHIEKNEVGIQVDVENLNKHLKKIMMKEFNINKLHLNHKIHIINKEQG